MEEKQNEEMLTHEGIYVGKTYRRSFQRDGKEEKVYGMMIKKNLQDQYSKSFTIFSTTKGVDEVEEGDYVRLGYIIKDAVNKEGKEFTSNLVLWISKKEQSQQLQDQQITGLPPLEEKPPIELNLSPDEEAGLNSLVGNPKYAPWKEYALKDAYKLKEALDGIANLEGLKLDIQGDHLLQVYVAFVEKCRNS